MPMLERWQKSCNGSERSRIVDQKHPSHGVTPKLVQGCQTLGSIGSWRVGCGHEWIKSNDGTCDFFAYPLHLVCRTYVNAVRTLCGWTAIQLAKKHSFGMPNSPWYNHGLSKDATHCRSSASFFRFSIGIANEELKMLFCSAFTRVLQPRIAGTFHFIALFAICL